ncbi:hypothetical protein [Teredinibacter franksiae]|uniref:hypothetical protein n=1 Tax=Teredinibacter franksiae TaxID=2761453 RepID=UPI0016248995|nr:hypothetical protein [Teredinibacter franksiae]
MKKIILCVLLFSPLAFSDWKEGFNKKVFITGENGCFVSIQGEVGPLIPFYAAAYNQKGFNTEKIEKGIRSAVSRSCDINAVDKAGISALIAGVLFNQPDLVRLVIGLGANPRTAVERPSKFAGLDSLGVIGQLKRKNIDRRDVESIIRGKI